MTTALATQAFWKRPLSENRTVVVASLVLLTVAVASRIMAYGDPVLHVDDEFYLLGGHEIIRGHLPYIDFWDRKPPGIFLLYAFFALFLDDVLAYQFGGTIFAWATSFVIFLMTRSLVHNRGAILAGMSYLVMLPLFGGMGGQTPVFYNLLIALAAYFAIRHHENPEAARQQRYIVYSMSLCGLALTIKPTTLPEVIFIASVIYISSKDHLDVKSSVLLLLKMGVLIVLPTALIGLLYAAIGAWADLWFAMVVSIFRRESLGATATRAGILYFLMFITPMAVIAARGLFTLRIISAKAAFFMTSWIGAAVVGFLLVPTFYIHYSLPLLVPLAVASGTVYNQPRSGPLLLGALALFSMLNSQMMNFRQFRKDKMEYTRLRLAATKCPLHASLFVQDGPPRLYDEVSARRLTRLSFPDHLGLNIEHNSIPVDQAKETERIMSMRPDVVVTADPPGARATGVVAATLSRELSLHYQATASAVLPLDLHFVSHIVWCRNSKL